MANNDSDFGAFMSGFLIGGLVGAAVALLMAPQSGEETRTMIREKGIEIRDQVETSATEARERAETMAKQARERAQDLQRRGQVILEEQKTKIEDVVDAGRKAARRKKDESAEA